MPSLSCSVNDVIVTESSEHLSEYVPWLIKDGRTDLIERFNIPLDEYPARCVDQIADWASMRAALLSNDPEAMAIYQAEKGETSRRATNQPAHDTAIQSGQAILLFVVMDHRMS